MPEVLHVKTEQIDTIEKRRAYTVSVIGCGQEGLIYGVAFAEAGFKVLCTDADQSLVKHLARGRTGFSDREIESKLKTLVRTGSLIATSDLKNAVLQSDIIILTIAAKIDDKKNSDYSEVENSTKQVGSAMKRGALAIYGVVAGFGFMENVVKEALENASGLKVGEDFGLAYSPLQASAEQLTFKSLGNRELKVAANDKTSLAAASTILATITKTGLRQAADFKTAELAALFSAVRRDMGVALANELAVLCENADIDYFEALKLLDSELPLTRLVPTIAENRKIEAYLLMETAENLNARLRMTALARQVNEDMVRHAVNLTQDALRSCGRTLRRARIAVLGATGQGTTGETFVKMLVAKGAKTSLYDPLLPKNENIDRTETPRRNLNEALEGADCLVLLSELEHVKRVNFKNLQAIMRSPAAIVDLTGTIEPQKAEKEGFIYRGLGRVTGKK